MDETQARLNITYNGQNGDLPDPVFYDATEGDLKTWATEAVGNGSVPGIDAVAADFTDFVVERYGPNDQRDHNIIYLRPKTPFG